jgi:hypothetical protein
VNFLCTIGLHRYDEVGAGQSIHRYIECRRCADRQVLYAVKGYQPVRTDWLAGGRSDDPAEGNPEIRAAEKHV